MKLIIGGSFQGKSAYAAEYCSPSPIVADGSTCTQEEILHCDILDHLHLYIRRLLKQLLRKMRLKNKLTAFAKTILPCALYVMNWAMVLYQWKHLTDAIEKRWDAFAVTLQNKRKKSSALSVEFRLC